MPIAFTRRVHPWESIHLANVWSLSGKASRTETYPTGSVLTAVVFGVLALGNYYPNVSLTAGSLVLSINKRMYKEQKGSRDGGQNICFNRTDLFTVRTLPPEAERTQRGSVSADSGLKPSGVQAGKCGGKGQGRATCAGSQWVILPPHRFTREVMQNDDTSLRNTSMLA